MVKKFLSWMVTACMIATMLPFTVLAVSAQNLTTWPTETLTAGEHTLTVTEDLTASNTVKVSKGVTLTVTGTGSIKGNGQTLFEVEEGGHLILDTVSIKDGTVGTNGAVHVKNGGKLDLGYNDKAQRVPPEISGNTNNGAAKNLVVAEGATVRLNATPTKKIGVCYDSDITQTGPKSLMEGGRYTLQASDIADTKISLDGNTTTHKLELKNDQIVVAATKLKILRWDSVNWWPGEDNRDTDIIQRLKDTGADVEQILGTRQNPKHLNDDATIFNKLLSYDFIFIDEPNVTLNETEKAKLLEFLNEGGRIFIMGENNSSTYVSINQKASEIGRALGGGFTISSVGGADGAPSVTIGTSDRAQKLMKGVTSLKPDAVSRVVVDNGAQGITELAYFNGNKPFIVDQYAGNKNGQKWGSLTAAGDSNWLLNSRQGHGSIFMKNLTQDAHENRIAAATGVNPNEAFTVQAKINKTPQQAEYRTPAAALAKVENNETVTLQTNTGLTPATNELLLNTATLKTADNHEYKATADSTYIDVSATGGITLKEGVLEVSANAPLTVQGTDGQEHKIQTSQKSTVTILDNGSAEVIPEQSGTITIDGVTYTYTNPSSTEAATISVPQAMKNSNEVTKAEVSQGTAATVEISDTESVKTTTGNITVEQAGGQTSVTLQQNADAEAFGYKVSNKGTQAATYKPATAGTSIPNRPSVSVAEGGSFEVDGHTYTATAGMTEFYLGEFDIKLTVDEHLTADPTTITRTVTEGKKYYGDVYEVTLKPMANYEIAPKNVQVEMNNQRLDAVATQEGENVKVQVTVKGNIVLNAVAKHQLVALTINKGTTSGSATVNFKNEDDRASAETVTDAGTVKVAKGEEVTLRFNDPTFFAWQKADNTLFSEKTTVTDALTVTPTFKNAVKTGTDGTKIGANTFKVNVKKAAAYTEENAKTNSAVQAVKTDGTEITKDQITADLSKLQAMTEAGTAQVTFTANGVSASVEVEVLDVAPVIAGKTAHTLTFSGEPNTEYTVKKPDGTTEKITTNANGKAQVTGLEKGKEYTISHDVYGETTVKTSPVDAKDIAETFTETTDQTSHTSANDTTEKAENSKVTVTVDEDGNYKVQLKENIDQTVEIPDTWGNVKIDLNGKTITGDNATETTPSKPGLIFKKDGGTEHPGTNLTVINGTIQGGAGSANHPNGAAGIGTDTAETPANAGITVGENANVLGGAGATGTNGNGGNGGAGISGEITPTISGGAVTGGSGGNGTNGGAGGNGGNGISTDNQEVTIESGTVTGGSGGSGGNSINQNGGSGGSGGAGIDSGTGNITVGQNGAVTGGSGGAGGASEQGNGGAGGAGGNGTTGNTTTSGKIEAGGGGNGGNSEQGVGGAGGAGGNGIQGNAQNNGTIDAGNGGNGGNGVTAGVGGTNGQGVTGTATGAGTITTAVNGAVGMAIGSMNNANTADSTNLLFVIIPCVAAAAIAFATLLKKHMS